MDRRVFADIISDEFVSDPSLGEVLDYYARDLIGTVEAMERLEFLKLEARSRASSKIDEHEQGLSA